MKKLISVFTSILLVSSLFVVPASAQQNQQIMVQPVDSANCTVMQGSEKIDCLKGLSGRDR